MYTTVLLTLGLWLAATAPILGTLGESESAARARAETWEQRYGALNPIIITQGGKVVQECWSGPPFGWSEAQALEFAQQLLPAAIRGQAPRPVPTEVATKEFRVDSYRILFIGLGSMVYDLEVATESNSGPRC